MDSGCWGCAIGRCEWGYCKNVMTAACRVTSKRVGMDPTRRRYEPLTMLMLPCGPSPAWFLLLGMNAEPSCSGLADLKTPSSSILTHTRHGGARLFRYCCTKRGFSLSCRGAQINHHRIYESNEFKLRRAFPLMQRPVSSFLAASEHHGTELSLWRSQSMSYRPMIPIQ